MSVNASFDPSALAAFAALGGPAAGNPLAALLKDGLRSIRDVRGVAGSFVVSELGRLLAHDLPALIGAEVLAEVGPRCLRLCDSFGESRDDQAFTTLEYSEYLLVLRPLRDGLLGVLAGVDVHRPALKMAMILASRFTNDVLDRSAGGAALDRVSQTGEHAPLPRAL